MQQRLTIWTSPRAKVEVFAEGRPAPVQQRAADDAGYLALLLFPGRSKIVVRLGDTLVEESLDISDEAVELNIRADFQAEEKERHEHEHHHEQEREALMP